MATADILVEGYFIEESRTRCRARPTITIIRDEGKNILVDTGNPKDKDIIVSSLKKRKLTPNDIDIVIITHMHPDHTGCNYLFKKARFMIPGVAFWDDVFDRSSGKLRLTKDLELIKTPGHTEDSATLLVKTEKGIVACVGDLFWFEHDERVRLLEDDCTNKRSFYKNRARMLRIADYIIPGHGKMFKTR